MARKINAVFILFGAFLFLVTENAFADAGTPLMWAGMLHLVIGNALIGILEGLLIAKIFGVKKIRSISIMVLANYISMIAGGLIVGIFGNYYNGPIKLDQKNG